MAMYSGERASVPNRSPLPWRKRPRFCFYYITDLCNARCLYCHFGDTKANDGHCHFAAAADVANNLDALRQIGVRFIDFTGGEPLLHPEIVTLLEMAKSRGFTTGLTTNGTLFGRYAAGLNHLVDHLEFSLDSANAQTNDSRRPGTSFTQILANLKLAREMGMRPTVIMTVSDQNVNEIQGVYHMTRDLGVRLILNPEFAAIKGENAGLAVLDTIAAYGRRPFVYVNWGLFALYRNGGNRRLKPRCRAMTAAIAIGPDNTLRGPCFHRSAGSLAIHNDLVPLRMSAEARNLEALQGRMPECEGCRISCYLELSLFYKIDRLWFLNALSVGKYELERRVSSAWDSLGRFGRASFARVRSIVWEKIWLR